MKIPVTVSIPGQLATAVLLLAAVLMQAAMAAGDNPTAAPAGPAYTDQDAPIEEITVIGERLILTLRQQIIESEDHAYDLFNELNDDNQYDIHCRMVALTGTLIKKRLCLPNFYHWATADNAAEYLNLVAPGNFPLAVSPSAKNVAAAKFPTFRDKVRELARENPDLLYALRDLSELAAELKQIRNIYHGVETDQAGE